MNGKEGVFVVVLSGTILVHPIHCTIKILYLQLNTKENLYI